MKQTFLMLAAITGALLTGCSNEEIANVDNLPQNAISFHLVGNAAETRATPITPSNLKDTDFDVFAFNASNGNIFMGNNDADFTHDGVHIIYNEDKWDYKDERELAHWPTDKLNFYAVNPATFDNNLMGYFTWLIHSDKQQIKYSTIDEFASNGHGVKNIDIMYAIAKNQTKNTNNGKVKLNFKHILSQVLFKAKVERASMKVTINSMKINNFYIGGTFTFPADDVLPTADNWDLTAHSLAGGYTIGMKESPISVASATDAVWISDEKNSMLFHPQKLTKWATTISSPMTKADADKAENSQSYLIIDCKIEQNGLLLHNGTLYVPFGADWQPGKRYIYTLIFGGGYDENGNPILTPIQFDAETTEWVDDAENDHEI